MCYCISLLTDMRERKTLKRVCIRQNVLNYVSILWVYQPLPPKRFDNLLRIAFENGALKTHFNTESDCSSCCQQFYWLGWVWFMNLFREGSHYLSFRITNHHSKTCLVWFSKHSSIKIGLHHTWNQRTPLLCLAFSAYKLLLLLQIFEAPDVILCIPRNFIQRQTALLKARLVPMVPDSPRCGCKQRY